MADTGSRPTVRMEVSKGQRKVEVEFNALSVDEASHKLARELEGNAVFWRKKLEGVLEAAISGKNAKIRTSPSADPLLFLGAIVTSLVAFSALAAVTALSGARHQHHH